jgi:phage terminase large subunit
MKAQFPDKLAALWTPSRYKFLRGGRGSGKSWGVARALLLMGADHFERILCTREVQKSIKQSVHQLLRDQIQALGLGHFYQVLENEIRGANGTQFFFSGLSDQTVDSIKSFEGCTKVWIEEGQTTTARSWNILTPTIRADGSEIWCTYNPELESDETHRRAVLEPAPDTITLEMNWSDNPWFPRVLDLERLEAQRTMKPADYGHIWEGRCKPAVEGAIYFDEVAKAEQEGRFRPFQADPLLKTHAVWDLGWNDAMSIILVQRSGAGEVRVVDYIEDTHRTLTDYVQQLKAMPHTWGSDWLPHDGFAREFRTGKSAEEILKALGRRVQATPRMDLEGGIKAARQVFARAWVNTGTPGGKRLVECLKRYRRNVSAKTGEAGAPLHDEHSHGADAWRYLALVADRLTNTSAAAYDYSQSAAQGQAY